MSEKWPLDLRCRRNVILIGKSAWWELGPKPGPVRPGPIRQPATFHFPWISTPNHGWLPPTTTERNDGHIRPTVGLAPLLDRYEHIMWRKYSFAICRRHTYDSGFKSDRYFVKSLSLSGPRRNNGHSGVGYSTATEQIVINGYNEVISGPNMILFVWMYLGGNTW